MQAEAQQRNDSAGIPDLWYDVSLQATAHELCMQLLTDLHTSDYIVATYHYGQQPSLICCLLCSGAGKGEWWRKSAGCLLTAETLQVMEFCMLMMPRGQDVPSS